MARAIQTISVSLGIVSMEAKLYKATKDDSFKIHSFCTCGSQPKQKIVCPSCSSEYTSWDKVPMRGIDSPLFTKEQWDEAGTVAPSKNIEIEAVVNFKDLATKYILSSPYFMLPDEGASLSVKKVYRLMVEALASQGWAVLSYANFRGQSKRIALIANKTQNILMTYFVEDRREVPFEPESVAVSDAERQLLVQLLQTQKRGLVDFPAPADGQQLLLEQGINVAEPLTAVITETKSDLVDLLRRSLEEKQKEQKLVVEIIPEAQ